ncbi:hypothetical protein CLOM_g5509 [Closterium sp. NIES-68]|nr:hypothetical protein CLOM_g5509 [Closterium sp. NIES-68]
MLAEHVKCDHGYTLDSAPIKYLLSTLAAFTPQEQRAFVRFVTGAPCLPPGGLAALRPKLTIVRKHPSSYPQPRPSSEGEPSTSTASPPTAGGGGAGSAGGSPMGMAASDIDLPSVMTCANYLKLPPYSSQAVMRQRLLYAIFEGQGSFDLS